MNINVAFTGRFVGIFKTGNAQVDLKEEANVRELLNVICDTDKRRRMIFSDGDFNLRPNIAIAINRRFIINLNWLDTVLKDHDNVTILIPASGG